MKTKDSTQDLSAALYKADKRSMQLLKQILSPLELSALRHDYKPFNFQFESAFIYVSGHACKLLKENSQRQVAFFTNQLEKDKHVRKVPAKLREVFEHPGEILSLPAQVRNRLCALECYTMLQVMIMGREFFLKHGEFGPKAMEAVEGLFERYKCGDLFK